METILRFRSRLSPLTNFRAPALVLGCLLGFASVASAQRTPLKPGWNSFSPEQDVEMGQQVSADAERELPMLNNQRVDDYLNRLGQRIATRAPGHRFPYSFKAVNDSAINAFALPGGKIYINRGVIEAADNEAQLLGVMAHEIAHVSLRHGTNQASKAYVAQVPLAVLGGVLGSNSAGAVLAQIGAGFAVNSILLKYSRTAERQADLLGTQMLYDADYEPRAMAQFFQKIQAEDQGGRPIEFFSNHPNPERRVESVNQEISKLGGQRRGTTNSPEFQDIKQYLQSLPAAPSGDQITSGTGGTGTTGRPGESPSRQLATFQNSIMSIGYPDNWEAVGQGDAVTIAPRNGFVQDRNGNRGLAYGVVVNIFQPHWDSYSQGLRAPSPDQSRISLEEATDQLVQEFRQSNPNMRVARSHEDIRVDGYPALSTYLLNDSPLGGREGNWLVTFDNPEGLMFLVFTAPEGEFRSYERSFQQILSSVRINR